MKLDEEAFKRLILSFNSWAKVMRNIPQSRPNVPFPDGEVDYRRFMSTEQKEEAQSSGRILLDLAALTQ